MRALLYNLRSLHNVGSIFRTADALGVEKIYMCGITPQPQDRFGTARLALAKVALGAEKSVPWEFHRQTKPLIKKLHTEGFKIFAVEQSAEAIPYQRLKIPTRLLNKTVLVVGNEVTGLPPSLLEICDKIVEIPMMGTKESLNVAVAFGIVAARLCHS